MRDGILAARRGVPAVAIVTQQFAAQGEFIARAAGMPAIPRAVIEHPMAGTGRANLERAACELAPHLIALLRGRTP